MPYINIWHDIEKNEKTNKPERDEKFVDWIRQTSKGDSDNVFAKLIG